MEDKPPPATPAPAPAPSFPWSAALVGLLAGVVAVVLLGGVGLFIWWWVKNTPIPGPDIVVPPAVKALPGRIVEIKVETKATEIKWMPTTAKSADWDMLDAWGGHRVFFVAPAEGEYSFSVIGILGGHLTQPFPCVITVGTPAPPVPPVPPTPPAPSPPIPAQGLRVLITYKYADIDKLPAEQRDVLYSQTVRDYLRQKAAKGDDGKTAEYRIYDETEDVSKESQLWQDAMKRPRKASPWIVISNGTTGFEGPLPATVDDTMTLLKKYGG